MTDSPAPIRVAIVDDHPVVREGTAALLDGQPGLRMVGTAASLDEAVPLLAPSLVDVLLLDIRLGPENGLSVLRGGAPRPAIVVLTAYDYPQYAAAALRLGASGFVVKTAPIAELVDAISKGGLGRTRLRLQARPVGSGPVDSSRGRRRPAGRRRPQQR